MSAQNIGNWAEVTDSGTEAQQSPQQGPTQLPQQNPVPQQVPEQLPQQVPGQVSQQAGSPDGRITLVSEIAEVASSSYTIEEGSKLKIGQDVVSSSKPASKSPVFSKAATLAAGYAGRDVGGKPRAEPVLNQPAEAAVPTTTISPVYDIMPPTTGIEEPSTPRSIAASKQTGQMIENLEKGFQTATVEPPGQLQETPGQSSTSNAPVVSPVEVKKQSSTPKPDVITVEDSKSKEPVKEPASAKLKAKAKPSPPPIDLTGPGPVKPPAKAL